jgi:hypothetical protein
MTIPERFGKGISRRRSGILCLALLVAGLFTATPAIAQNSGFKIEPIDKGLVVGAIVGIAVVAAAAVVVIYLVVHNHGAVVGCIVESGGKKTLVSSDKKVYSLADSGPQLPVGERAKLKGHKSGPGSAPTFQVVKVLKDYGHCQP